MYSNGAKLITSDPPHYDITQNMKFKCDGAFLRPNSTGFGRTNTLPRPSTDKLIRYRANRVCSIFEVVNTRMINTWRYRSKALTRVYVNERTRRDLRHENVNHSGNSSLSSRFGQNHFYSSVRGQLGRFSIWSRSIMKEL
jgi:hypothetical protein